MWPFSSGGGTSLSIYGMSTILNSCNVGTSLSHPLGVIVEVAL